MVHVKNASQPVPVDSNALVAGQVDWKQVAPLVSALHQGHDLGLVPDRLYGRLIRIIADADHLEISFF
jgi:hypothetical protein